ncbi:serine/threonine-protein kinase KIN2 [Maudiozyma exigua]|uniref:non-specific serine/threonine protein kinase n=1 Tax=Maudiozyma exigua TaxID=34358 RepID=A0A9P7B731_MAUEX|nr:serine/threonine-protein kinase KIN2 [Kazachstania exigua]
MAATNTYFTRSAGDLPTASTEVIYNIASQEQENVTNDDTVPRLQSPATLTIFKHNKHGHGMETYQELSPKQKDGHEHDSNTVEKNYTYKNKDLVPHQRFHRTSIGDWQFMETVGQGSMGKVKLAQNDNTGKLVAVKVVNRALKVFLMKQQKGLTNGERRRAPRTTKELQERETALNKELARDRRTVREAVLGQLMCHPNICELYEWHILSNHYYLIFEYVSGGQLLDYIIQNGLLSERKSREFARTIGSVLLYLHKNNIVHRDLKIENIMIGDNGELKMIDFGLSNFYDSQSLLKTYCGSLYFAAPELLCATPYVGPEIDIWSFGVVIYVLVCGKVPFDDSDSRKLHQKIKRGKVTYPDFISSEANSLLKEMLVVDPNKRATLTKVLKHPWINHGFHNPVECNIPSRPPLTVGSLDWEVLQEMETLELVEDAHLTKRQIEDIIKMPKYVELCKQYWAIIKATHNGELISNSDMPTIAYHPLLSQYYLTSEYLMKKNSTEPNLKKVIIGQSVLSGHSVSGEIPNIAASLAAATATAPAAIMATRTTSQNSAEKTKSKYAYLPLKLRRMSEPHVSPTRKTHYDPSADYVTTHEANNNVLQNSSNEDQNSTIIKSQQQQDTPKESKSGKGKRKIKKLLRRLSAGFRNPVSTPNKIDENVESTIVAPVVRESVMPKLKDITDDDDYVVPLTAPEPQKKKTQGRSKSVGNERQLLESRDSRVVNAGSKNEILSERQIVKLAKDAPLGAMPSIQYTSSIFTKGVLSVQTTSSKPLAVVRYKIINALERSSIEYEEIKGGFRCIVYKSGDYVNRDLLQAVNYDTNATEEHDMALGTSPVESPVQFEDISDEDIGIDPTQSQHLNVTTETIHQLIPELIVDISNNDTVVPVTPVVTDTNTSTDKGTTITSKQDTVLSSPIAWNENHPFIANERTNKIVFEIFIAKIKFLGLIGIHFKKISGDSWKYKEIAATLIKDMNL